MPGRKKKPSSKPVEDIHLELLTELFPDNIIHGQQKYGWYIYTVVIPPISIIIKIIDGKHSIDIEENGKLHNKCAERDCMCNVVRRVVQKDIFDKL